MKAAVENWLQKIKLYDAIRALYQLAIRTLRHTLGWDRKLVRQHLENASFRGLQIGCGFNRLPGWLNSDYHPLSRDILHLDASKRFPIPDDSLQFIYSEHMIEHIPYPDGVNMLAEAYRVLAPGGVLRLSTPNLAFFARLHASQKTEKEREYIDWNIITWVPHASFPGDAFLINSAVRDWGHRFIYDRETLVHALTQCGYLDIKNCDMQQSEHPELRNLANEQRMPPGLLRLETLTVEASKPQR